MAIPITIEKLLTENIVESYELSGAALHEYSALC